MLMSLIEEHVRRTGSTVGSGILADPDTWIPKFKKVIPHDYAKMLKSIEKFENDGLSVEEAGIKAFYENTGR